MAIAPLVCLLVFCDGTVCLLLLVGSREPLQVTQVRAEVAHVSENIKIKQKQQRNLQAVQVKGRDARNRGVALLLEIDILNHFARDP